MPGGTKILQRHYLKGIADIARMVTFDCANSYEPERQPIARAWAEASLGPARPPARIDSLVLGYNYDASGIVSDATPAPSHRRA